MKLLAVERDGEKAQRVVLKGNPKQPEPEHFRVTLPGGDVDIARCDDGSYWVHVRVDRPGAPDDDHERTYGRILGGRIDVHGKHTVDVNPGALADPGLYHLAVHLGREGS